MTFASRLLICLGLLSCTAGSLRAAPSAPYRVAAGVNLGGGQLDWRINQRWMLEFRGQNGSDVSDGQTTRSEIIGLRGYRFFGSRHPQFFVGLQAGSASAKRSGSTLDASGMAVGAFGGIELKLMRHLFLLADGGPYTISLREKSTGVTNSTVTFVADLALVVGF